ncbi:hypothetical protein DKL61_15140 [Gammaproteobacteria bacterium ESL0073]|nr:hypothetical protein DKL61_15140 [Gammaproteobacteria bacterium ESL0073]
MATDLYASEWQKLDPKPIIENAITNLNTDVGAVFEREVLAAFKKLYQSDPASFARYRQQIKDSKKIDLALFTKLVTQQSDSKPIHKTMFEIFPPLEMWDQSIDGCELLDEIKQTISQYIIADEQTIIASTLWATFTWFIDVVNYAPIANITAPEKRCGKSKLLGVLKRLSYKALSTANISAPALFRLIEKDKPTLLIDEVDSFLALHDDMRGIINASFTRESAFVIRCAGEDLEPTPFNVWGAKALCGIGKIADTLQDRSIILRLRRKYSGESVQDVDRSNKEHWATLRAKLARFAQDNQHKVLLSNPAPIPQLNDRANDCWLPLLQIASIAGGHWLNRAINTALTINGAEEEPESIRVELLRDIQTIFTTKKVERLFSHDLVTALNEDNEANWVTWNKGRGITARNLAKILKEFNILSNTIRIGINNPAKGYTKEQFNDAFTRYLSLSSQDTPLLSVTTLHVKEHNKNSQNTERYNNTNVTDKKTPKDRGNNECNVVTDKIPFLTEEKEKPNNKGNVIAEKPENKINQNNLLLADDEEAF